MANSPSAHPTSQEDDERNLPSRIFQSAANLTRNLVIDSHPISTTNTLANNVGSTGKAGASSSIAGGSSSSSLQADVATRRPGLAHGLGKVVADGSFREVGLRSTMQAGEEEIYGEMGAFNHNTLSINDASYTPEISADQYPQDLSTAWKGKAPLHTKNADQSHEGWINHFHNQHPNLSYTTSIPPARFSHPANDIETAETNDGSDVISLLQTPGSLTNPSMLTSDFQDNAEVSADDLFSPPQTPSSRSAVARYKADLPPPPAFTNKQTLFSELTNRFQQDEEGWDEWLSIWDEVMDRYTDEVWGPKEPIVREARGEVDQMKAAVAAGTMGQGRAVERLRMILEHLRMSGR